MPTSGLVNEALQAGESWEANIRRVELQVVVETRVLGIEDAVEL